MEDHRDAVIQALGASGSGRPYQVHARIHAKMNSVSTVQTWSDISCVFVIVLDQVVGLVLDSVYALHFILYLAASRSDLTSSKFIYILA